MVKATLDQQLFNEEETTVITPYKFSRDSYMDHLRRNNLWKVHVSTLDGHRGGEHHCLSLDDL